MSLHGLRLVGPAGRRAVLLPDLAVPGILLFCIDLLYGTLNGKAVHKAAELFWRKFPGFIRCTRPLETVACEKLLGQEQHPVTFFSEHSEKSRYPQGFVIRTFFPEDL